MPMLWPKDANTLIRSPVTGQFISVDGEDVPITFEIQNAITAMDLLEYDPALGPDALLYVPGLSGTLGLLIDTHLQTMVGLYTDQVVTCVGKTTQGDGGEGQFQWRPGSSTAEDNTNVIQVGARSGRWHRITSAGGNPTGTGDWTGPASGNTVVGIRGKAVSATLPTAGGQRLEYNGTQWFAGPARTDVLATGGVTPQYLGQIIATYDPLDQRIGWFFRWNGSTWVQTSDRSRFDVDAFGAKGTNSPTDAAANVTAFQAAINACTANGTELYIGPRKYYLNGTLVLDSQIPSGTYNGQTGLRITGCNSEGTAEIATQLLWSGSNPSGSMWAVASNANWFTGFAMGLRPTSGNDLGAYFAVQTSTPGSQTVSIRGNQFYRLAMYGGGNGGTGPSNVDFGIQLGIPLGLGQSNLEDTQIERNMFYNIRRAGVCSNAGQPYRLTIVSSKFYNYLNPTNGSFGNLPYGRGIENNIESCNMVLIDCDFQHQARCVWNKTHTKSIVVIGGQSEGCKLLYSQDGYGTTGAASQIQIIGGRHAVYYCNADGGDMDSPIVGGNRFLWHNSAGSLSMHGVHIWGDGSNVKSAFKIYSATGHLNVQDCNFPNIAPFELANTAGKSGTLTHLNNHGFAGTDGAAGVLRRIQWETFGSANLPGTVTFTDAATTAAIAFPFAEPVDSTGAAYQYDIEFSLVSWTGSPPSDVKYKRPWVQPGSKIHTGCTAEIDVAPGVGNSVTYRWRVRG